MGHGGRAKNQRKRTIPRKRKKGRAHDPAPPPSEAEKSVQEMVTPELEHYDASPPAATPPTAPPLETQEPTLFRAPSPLAEVRAPLAHAHARTAARGGARRPVHLCTDGAGVARAVPAARRSAPPPLLRLQATSGGDGASIATPVKPIQVRAEGNADATIAGQPTDITGAAHTRTHMLTRSH